ncbi:MAG: hypothetical protein J0J06_14265 [Sphingomonas sp.]|uniref:tetratricopeptide repeat protein n=1 Tax=Sphingomonas sp. TaxID=28214 RepID=UPI001ACDB2E3|nr:hypothetical protein [Sphingomonas sp.]MBN8816597.1 hypothetical protein [Sphingomonas sp.]
MPLGRWFLTASAFCLATPALAQKTPGSDIVVTSDITKKKQAITWKRAESDHVIVFSQGSDAELTRVAKNIERLYHLMSRLYRRGDESDVTVKLQVTLVDSAADLRAMRLADLRSTEGPYLQVFDDQAYYDPRADGAVLAVARSDRTADLNTSRAQDLDCTDALADGAMECDPPIGRAAIYYTPAIRTWEQRLYGAYARHFLLTYAPAVYPRWYLDGIGALFSTLTVRGNGAVDYAAPPENYRQVLRSYVRLDVADVLSGRYLTGVPGKAGWNPYQAWLLTHYFVFSALKPDRYRQYQAYMAAIAAGKPMAEAAAVFGDMKRLNQDLFDYVDRDKSYARTAPAQPIGAEPTVSILSPGGAATVLARLQLDTQLAATDADGAARRDGWIAQLRETIGKLPFNPDATLLLAEAECRAGQPAACVADADRVLAASPDNVRALAWRGVALTDRAVNGEAPYRAARLALARDAIKRALAIDGDSPLALIAQFQSYALAGERVPDTAMAGMAGVVRLVPAAPAPRLYLAEELLRQQQADAARRLIRIVIDGAYDSPERTVALREFGSAMGAPASGR